jgi:hypothetical protein
LVLFYPDHLGTLATLDLAENVDLLPEGERPVDAQEMMKNWATGRRMSDAETDQYAPQLPPTGLRKVGWRAEKVKPAHYAGVLFQRK